MTFKTKQTQHSFTLAVKSGGSTIEEDISTIRAGVPYRVPTEDVGEMINMAYDAHRWNRDTRTFDFLKLAADLTLCEGDADAVRKALDSIE